MVARVLARWRHGALSRAMWRWKQAVDYARFEVERSSERLAERRGSAVRFIWRVAVRCERRTLSGAFVRWRRRSEHIGREAAASARVSAVEEQRKAEVSRYQTALARQRERLASMAAEWRDQQAQQTALSVEAEAEMSEQLRMAESAMAKNHERVSELQSQLRERLSQERQRAAAETVRAREASLGMVWRMLSRWRHGALSQIGRAHV